MTHYYRGEKYIRLPGQMGKHRFNDTEKCHHCGHRYLIKAMSSHIAAFHRPKEGTK